MVTWADRKGPIGSEQEQAWFRLHSVEPLTFGRQCAAIRAVLRGLSDYPSQMTSHETGDDGAPQLRDEIVSRAEVLCCLSLLPDRQRQAVVLVHLHGLPRAQAAKQLNVAIGILGKQMVEAFESLALLIFDYEPAEPDAS